MTELKNSIPTSLSFNDLMGVHTNVQGIDFPLEEGFPVHLQFSVFSEPAQLALTRILDRFLIGLDIIFVRESVLGSLRELITNAIKANAKRMYFESNQVNIHDQDSYNSLMKIFKQEYLKNRLTIDKSLENSKYFIITSIAYNKNTICLTVMNNISLTVAELNRIQDKLQKAGNYNDLSEAIMEAGDDTEGAGLGLIMATMMLKNDGIPVSSIQFNPEDNRTSIAINIPLGIGISNPQYARADRLLKEIDHLPTFPDTILELQKYIDNPDSSIIEIGAMIQKDISLTASVLKLANSAAYRRGDKVESMSRSIQLIGLKGLRTLLFSLGTKQIIQDKFPVFLEIWDRSNESAFYTKLIGQKMNQSKEQQNNLISSALLHDIGEVILLTLEKENMGEIQSLSQSKDLSSTLSLEEFIIGITHSKLGAMIAEKWNFPEAFSMAMEYHHKPLQTPEEYKYIVYPIYLSDMMIKLSYSQNKTSEIPEKVLEYCGFRSLEEFQFFQKQSQENYSNSLLEKD